MNERVSPENKRPTPPLSRREFLKLSAYLLAELLLLTSCGKPKNPGDQISSQEPEVLGSPQPKSSGDDNGKTKEIKPSPSPTPTLKKADFEIGQVLAIGGETGEIRTVKADELKGKLGAVAKDWIIYTGNDGMIRYQATIGENGILHHLLPYAPEGFRWQDEPDKQLWVSEDGKSVFIPDVDLPGGWVGDEKTGRAGPIVDAEAIFLTKVDGQYQVGVYYSADKIRQIGIDPKNFLAERRSPDPKNNQVFDLENGDVVYLSDPKTEKLTEGERIERLANGDLVKILPDGSYLYRITSWANVQSPDDLRFVGAFEGAVDLEFLGVKDRPPVPFAPASFVPEDWQAKGYRYGFDSEKGEAILYQGEKQEVARARYDQRERKWRWEKRENTRFALTPAVLNREEAANVLAGGEYWTEKDLKERLAGRVFNIYDNRDGQPAGMILLSQKAKEALAASGQKIEESEWMRILEEGIERTFARFVTGASPFNIWINTNVPVGTPAEFLIIQPPPILFLWENNQPIVVFLVDNKEAINRNYIGYVGKASEEKGVTFEKIPLYGYERKKIGSSWEAVKNYNFRLLEAAGQLVADDGYQVRAVYEKKKDGEEMDWRPILPHERKEGEYEILTPEQRINAILKEYGQKYGLLNSDGSPKKEAFKILYNNRGEPAVLLLVEGKNGAPEQYGLNPTLNNPQMFEKAWNRLVEIDPDIADILTRVYGLKIIGGDLDVGFVDGREFYNASYSQGEVQINEKQIKHPSLPVAMFLILVETRAMAHDAGYLVNGTGKPYWARALYDDPEKDKGNPGVDKGNFVLEWIKRNRLRLTKEEIITLTDIANFVKDWYRQRNIKTLK